MVVKITYFVHGTTTDNEQGLSTGWNHGELSEKGIEQSKVLPSQINGKVFDAIIVSDLKRAIHSAKLTWSDDADILIDPRFRECNYGKRNGTVLPDEEKEEHTDEPFPEGESYKDVERRIRFALNDIKKYFDGKHVAIVAHQAPQLAIEVVLNGKTWQQAFANDWRASGQWQPGWEYEIR